jgi:hypothetical protein
MARRRAIFKIGERVRWVDPPGEQQRVGTVCDIHKLGGYGFHYEVQPDGPGATVELQEGELHRGLVES